MACVILEPFIFDAPKDNFLHEIARLCKENGTLLIFDEMWTGFRIAIGGAQEYFGITPDLAVYSKAFANGMPIALLTGRKDVMTLFEQDVFFFTTFGGEALSMAAAMATIAEMREKNVPAALAAQGKKLREGYNEIAAELGIAQYTKCYGYDCRSMVTFDPSAGNGLGSKSLRAAGAVQARHHVERLPQYVLLAHRRRHCPNPGRLPRSAAAAEGNHRRRRRATRLRLSRWKRCFAK